MLNMQTVVCIICVQINALISDAYSTRLFPKGLLHIGGAKFVIFTFHIIFAWATCFLTGDGLYLCRKSKRNHWFNKMTIKILQREISKSNCYHYDDELRYVPIHIPYIPYMYTYNRSARLFLVFFDKIIKPVDPNYTPLLHRQVSH